MLKIWPPKKWLKVLFLMLPLTWALYGCLNEPEPSQTAAVQFKNPNSESLLEQTQTVIVQVVYPAGDTVFFYSGPLLTGPWNGSIQKSDLDLIISQYNIDGVLLTSESYSYAFTNGTLKILSKLELNPSSIELIAGGNPTQINAKLFPSDLSLAITWSSADTAIAKVTPEGIVDPIAAGQVFIFAAIGESLKDSVLVTVLGGSANSGPISIITGLSDGLVNIGDNAEFSVLANGSSIQYKWSINNIVQDLANQAQFTIPSVSLDMNGSEVSVEVYNGDTSIILTAILYVLDPAQPLALLKPIPDTSLTEGASIIFIARANKTEGLSYSWTKDGAELSDQSELLLSNLSFGDEGLYILEINWNGETISDSFTLSIASPVLYNITLEAGENGKILNGGVSLTSLSVPQGENASFIFEPNEGYVIANVLVDGSENPEAAANGGYTFSQVNDHHTLQVSFEKAQLSVQLQINDSTKGTVEMIPEKTSFSLGDTLSLRAIPNGSGYKFTGWSGDTSSENNPLILIVTQNHSIMANFGDADRYSVNISPNPGPEAGAISISPDTGNYISGTQVSLTATPSEGYQFTGWSGNIAELSGTANPLLLTIADSDINGTASLERIPIQISFSTNPAAGSPGNPNSDVTSTLWGDTLNITANPATASGWEFSNWELAPTSSGSITFIYGTDEADESATVVISGGNIQLIANYALREYTITVTQSNGGTIFLDGQLPDISTTVTYGDNANVSFNPNTGFNINDVLIDGASNSSAIASGAYSFQNITGNHSVSATFALNQYTVTFDLDDKGTRTGGGALSQSVAHGANATAPSVQADVGWVFDGWDAGFTNVTQNLTVTATYLPEMYNVTVTAGTGGNVSPSGVRSVAHGSNLNITATAISGYVFENWTSSGLSVSNANSATTSVTNVTFGGTVTANFRKLWVCGDPLVDDRPNLVQETYSTVPNGSQCWMGENLRAGTYRSAAIYTQDPTDNVIEKYCWNNTFSNCATDGGFYVWLELMANDSTPKSQGICPNGWHVPDTTEFRILINSGVDINLGGNGTFVIDTKTFGSGDAWYWLSSQQSGSAAPHAVSIRESGPQIEYWFSSLTAFYARCIKD